MSQVSAYVESQEGHWYRNPVARGDGWFICWDDDEPIELVVRAEKDLQIADILDGLAKAGWRLRIIGTKTRREARVFEDDEFHPATSCFLQQLHEGPTDAMLVNNPRLNIQPQGQGVYFLSAPPT